jgi:hypothetical protein
MTFGQGPMMVGNRVSISGSDMSIPDRGAWILVGLTTLAALLISAPEAEGTSITITGQQRPGTGDPLWYFLFDVTLQTNSPPILAGNSFTIEGLIGVTPPGFPASGDSGSSVSGPNSSWIPSITSSSAGGTILPYASDVTWTYDGSIPISASSAPIDLGLFTVETTVSFPTPPYASGTLIYYSYNIGAESVSGSGSFPMSVPEPGSLTLLAIGAGVLLLSLPTCWRRRLSYVSVV